METAYDVKYPKDMMRSGSAATDQLGRVDSSIGC